MTHEFERTENKPTLTYVKVVSQQSSRINKETDEKCEWEQAKTQKLQKMEQESLTTGMY